MFVGVIRNSICFLLIYTPQQQQQQQHMSNRLSSYVSERTMQIYHSGRLVDFRVGGRVGTHGCHKL